MITARIHLDDCDEENGALRVLPGSHREGKLAANDISRWAETHETSVCNAQAGDVLFMRPLLLHSSLRANNPVHRRVLHLEYASEELPNGLKWVGRL